MNDSKWFSFVAVSAAALVLALGALMMAFPGASPPARTVASPSTAGPSTILSLTIAYNPSLGAASFSSSTISLAAHTRVMVTITNYDTSVGSVRVPWDNQVVGTTAGSEMVGYGNGAVAVTSLPSNGISHTFTVHDAYYNISIPIPPAQSPSVPSIVTFELTLNWAETTSWACMNDCHDGMMGVDRMYGPLVVTG
jgi:hypothetical protein